ncbi:probable GPI-anchored adhesin-like protein PGA55 isoform X2 [Drosophila busckii]|uniref:probable GPI-anchored adhesin-like protein PGA55 isoform X2 n=1 Tax=Drosophila busckii TaxID=30019 RepID=UPI001432EE86|nr:probable GPI-anchored adhesin-like protein PGA55 isoform X2 [Drosophila busckii]
MILVNFLWIGLMTIPQAFAWDVCSGQDFGYKAVDPDNPHAYFVCLGILGKYRSICTEGYYFNVQSQNCALDKHPSTDLAKSFSGTKNVLNITQNISLDRPIIFNFFGFLWNRSPPTPPLNNSTFNNLKDSNPKDDSTTRILLASTENLNSDISSNSAITQTTGPDSSSPTSEESESTENWSSSSKISTSSSEVTGSIWESSTESLISSSESSSPASQETDSTASWSSTSEISASSSEVNEVTWDSSTESSSSSSESYSSTSDPTESTDSSSESSTSSSDESESTESWSSSSEISSSSSDIRELLWDSSTESSSSSSESYSSTSDLTDSTDSSSASSESSTSEETESTESWSSSSEISSSEVTEATWDSSTESSSSSSESYSDSTDSSSAISESSTSEETESTESWSSSSEISSSSSELIEDTSSSDSYSSTSDPTDSTDSSSVSTESSTSEETESTESSSSEILSSSSEVTEASWDSSTESSSSSSESYSETSDPTDSTDSSSVSTESSTSEETESSESSSSEISSSSSDVTESIWDSSTVSSISDSPSIKPMHLQNRLDKNKLIGNSANSILTSALAFVMPPKLNAGLNPSVQTYIMPVKSYCNFLTNGAYLRDPSSCGKFYVCANGRAISRSCPKSLYFDIKNKVCNLPHLVDCSSKESLTLMDDIGAVGKLNDDALSTEALISSTDFSTTATVAISATSSSESLNESIEHRLTETVDEISAQPSTNSEDHSIASEVIKALKWLGIAYSIPTKTKPTQISNFTNGKNELKNVKPLAKELIELSEHSACSSLPNGAYVRDAKSCSKFYVCANGRSIARQCPTNLYFDIKKKVCNFPRLVDCQEDDVETNSALTDDLNASVGKNLNTASNMPKPIKLDDSVNIKSLHNSSNKNNNAASVSSNVSASTLSPSFDKSIKSVNINLDIEQKSSSNIKISSTAIEGSNECSQLPNGAIFRDSQNCGKFYICSNGIPVPKLCPGRLYFDQKKRVCNFPSLVDCSNDKTLTYTSKTASSASVSVAPVNKDLTPDCSLWGNGAYIRDASSCGKFYVCVNGRAIPRQCPNGLYIDIRKKFCNFPSQVDCSLNVESRQLGGISVSIITDCSRMDNGSKLRDSKRCNKFYVCMEGKPVTHYCEPGKWFDIGRQVCDQKRFVNCNN